MTCNARTYAPFVPVMVVVVPSSHQTDLDLGPDLGPTTFQAPEGGSRDVSVVDLDFGLDLDLGPAFQGIAGSGRGSVSGRGGVWVVVWVTVASVVTILRD